MDDDLIPDVLVEPAVPRRVCADCGCSWDADADVCPECEEPPRRRCAYCEAAAVPGLPHHNGWPVCAEHMPSAEVIRALS